LLDLGGGLEAVISLQLVVTFRTEVVRVLLVVGRDIAMAAGKPPKKTIIFSQVCSPTMFSFLWEKLTHVYL
jgi:hypothetical protein